MLLKKLLEDIPRIKVEGDTDLDISGITHDSRKVKKGNLFICLPGSRTDGHEYINEAVSRGAAAVLMQEKHTASRCITAIKTKDPRRIISRLAAKYYGYPSRSLRLTGVTGTNGKTSTTHFIDRILSHTGPTGLIGTISYKIGSIRRPVEATTPEASTLQEIFREMVDHNVRYCTMEVSSHALALNRVDDCDFNVAVLTNITEDHLDFHKTFNNYLKAKAALFKKLVAKQGNYAIINNDDSNAAYIKRVVSAETVTYGIRNQAQVKAEAVEIKPGGVSFVIKSWADSFSVNMQISGLFTVYNALAAIALGLKEGIAAPVIKEALEKIPCIPGRFEQVQEGQDFYVIIDYAHTPDGLENILFSTRQFCDKKIITV
ncbi:MAG TPA: UDP-N-acetylmuramoyl-L-alanyl-D-glutamate--2,6-diaminopimelate ligase, partial [Firmicutes bacterium]|nr:UDP-N-acetylmuramoyl-L-alanyl-D-glutamate--2,6-diaminopimelate ligase [Bacillota bacterium]